MLYETAPLSASQFAERLVGWWHEGRPNGTELRVVSESGSAAILQEVHARLPDGVLVDAAGAGADDVFRRTLALLGVPESELTHHGWHRAAKRLAKGKLVLLTNVWRAGTTRRSAHPAILQDYAAGRLALLQAGVVVDAGPDGQEHGQEHGQPRRGVVTLGLDESANDDPHVRLKAHITSAMASPHIRALALSEPRQVPLPVWTQLARAADVPDSNEDSLRRLAARFPDLLTIVADQVVFNDEAVPEALRRDTPDEVTIQVNRHMARWLRQLAPQLRHPDGWARSGAVGEYAAQGLAMHAVQAGEFDELLSDGEALANLPQRALMDAAHCAYDGSLPGCNPAADAVFLQMNGALAHSQGSQGAQGEWAAWLHLMATARGDTELCVGIANSGVRLPWRTLWTRWCPPGGYHPSYLTPGPVYELFAVRWQGRPAVASSASDDTVRIWDLATSELLAGPWPGEEFPPEQRGVLTWDTDHAGGQLSPEEPGPTSLEDLRAHERDTPGPGEAYEFLPLALDTGSIAVVAGVGGLFAVESTDPESSPEITPLTSGPLLGNRTAAGPAWPKHAAETTASDFGKLFPDASVVRTPASHIPSGLSEETARRVLIDIGVPAASGTGIGFWPNDADFLNEQTWPTDGEQPEEAGPFFFLGLWMGGKIVIDGASGHVLRIPSDPDESGLAGVLLAVALDRFLRMLTQWITGLRILRRIDNSDEAHLLRQHIDDAIWDIDSEGSTAGAWQYPLYNE
ncbi:SUKH-4 family immunity protein [Streptomyces sp. V3I7]|uniref:SUKH-4 family immunity protein n=1 Tax=Streptomyces sp. V3I7 TaxID=3042278 RepID=UPI0027861D32|nr:SUKH-4 family immunity protein [Streptomyces sp. V3I7]MDQ0993407.1 hypothetical protein [Streptomyces sp. V3I7]